MSAQHYEGGCQCGKVSYEVDVDLDQAIVCNCSRCKPMGFTLTFAPAEAFRLKSGEGETTEYLFNNNVIRHLFCKTCGVQSFAYGQMPDGKPVVAVNVNCLKGVDPRALSVTAYDGASM
ncbi:aldehyde-activating protein [Oceanicola sp. 22II-s10i]|uniref:GFA family protein n=1 Tax=Oceanicola sp. 22II-s10i TaxID=1317116 RepID=UPI000B5258DE|nr:GFA family protein [Oceanicola sp. 22II-s10i]OWU83429.1 aldehyde-activating protein [Oceanicola sp. 22II-s10i]